jgi:hypothetical protein
MSGDDTHTEDAYESAVQKCPLCKSLYGIDAELETLWVDERKVYHCNNKDLHHEFCEHILKATRKDMAHFSCQGCPSSIDECDCFDCWMVFCDQCNSFISLSCSDVVQMMELNEEKQP